jgi:hypothetical protein
VALEIFDQAVEEQREADHADEGRDAAVESFSGTNHAGERAEKPCN